MAAYLIATIEVHRPQAYEAYREQVPAVIARHGGRYIVRGGAAEVLEGSWPPGRIVVLEFPDYAAARAFTADPDYRPVAAIRHDAARSHIWLVDGVPGGPPQAALHGYLLGRVRIDDADAYRSYVGQVPDALARLGGTYLARGGRCEASEGGRALDRIVIVGFADVAAAKAFHGAPDYAPLRALRTAASDSNIVVVAGL